MTDEELKRIRDGFDQRAREAFEAERGKPLVRAKKRPPLRPGRGNYVRHYSYSIVEFATRCFLLDEQIDEANAALLENAQHYLDSPKDIDDRDSFHWHSEMLCRLIELYGSKGSVAPGRLRPETEKHIMETLWRYASRHSRVADADVERSRTWHIYESENHHAQIFTTAWHFAKLAKESPEFRDRKYEDGFTAAEHHAAWTEYIKAYCTERAKKGLFVEVGSDGYNTVLLKGLYNVFDFAEDGELRRRVGCLLDFYWASWAQEQIDGVRGGGRARIYQTGGDRRGGGTHTRALAWFYFGMGEPSRLSSPLLSALTSAYRPRLVVIDLACDVGGRGRYGVHQRPLGLAEPGYNAPPDYRLRTDTGGIHRYSWCTPAFIMGTLMVEPRPASDWTHISSQNRWHGVIFAGHLDARIVPQCQAADGRVAHNAQWAVQSQGTLICRKLNTNRGARAMRVWFSAAGLVNRTEEAGWVFVEAPEAYAGVRVVIGDAEWEPSGDRFKGDWLRCGDEWSPVILEVACKEDFADYAAFREAVIALPLSVEDNVLTYQGLGGDEFKFFIDQNSPPEVNGKPVDYEPPVAFESPFVHAAWDSGVVTITKDDRTLVLDFNSP
jgi:hypothetical protein